MTGLRPILPPPVAELEPKFAELIPALVTRGRREVVRRRDPGVAALAGGLEALAVDTLRALTHPGAAPLPASRWSERIALGTGARVVIARRHIRSPGPRGGEAFERALLVAFLWDLRRRREAAEEPDELRTSWEGGLPVTLGGPTGGPTFLFLSARPARRAVGEGLALGFSRSGCEAALDLVVPVMEPGDARVYALQVRRRL